MFQLLRKIMSGQECQGLGFTVVIFLCFSFFLHNSWKWRSDLCCGKYRVAMWWLYRQADRVKMDVGDRQQGYHCHFTDQEVPHPESIPCLP